jgi:hypothetical protein
MSQEEREAWFRYIQFSDEGKARFKDRLGLADKAHILTEQQQLEQTLAELLGIDIPSSEGVEDA